MKKVFIVLLNLVIIGLIVLLGVIFIYPYLYFDNMESTPMNIWIVDKTVPNTEYREHTGLLWMLNSRKITSDKTDALFEYQKDYFGFFPINIDTFEIKELPADTEYPDLIYLADTYGVYKDDYFQENTEGTRSELIHGGLQSEEVVIIKENLGTGNTIIGEFNTASAPTNTLNRDQLGEIFRMNWTGWSGRYFKDLSKGIEVPVWAVKSYEEQNNEEWNYTGEGFILVSDQDEIIVFEKKKDFGNEYVYIAFDEKYYDEFGIKGDIPYDYWFEFTIPDMSAEVLASFTFDVTEEGAEKLEALGLASTFPAVIRNANTQYTAYYFAGDFADGVITYKWWNFAGFSKIKKILPMGDRGDNSKFFWRCYAPMMNKIIDDINIKKEEISINTEDEEVQYNVKTTSSGFQVLVDNKWQDFFIKGVNVGSSTPGKWFTQFETSEELYIDWLIKIADMNANTVRVYTLLPPQFYTAFVYYNETHPDKPLWLYQEIWPEENPEDKDYLKDEYNDEYIQEIENVINALNGHANIAYRKGRAYGIYTSDVSPYLAGYLVGRELEPEEVESTNDRNEGYLYNGEYLYCSEHASPTEAWLAMSCDYVLKYETETYNWQHPVGIVSWPTLDVAEHDSEWNETGEKELEYNDRVSVDINNINVKNSLKTGFFGAYHIYPNYPDFMNNEEKYALYEDDEGTFRYGGYLQEFMETHKKYPALVAEFGLATGITSAHSNPDGYNHGGMTETEQGEGIIRMMQAIERENYAGGIIFEWTDEWAKKTWTTEPYIIPYERNVLWHNMLDPEQNYGIFAMEAGDPVSEEYEVEGEGRIKNINLFADEEYLHIEVTLDKAIDMGEEDLILGIDTLDRNIGDRKYSENITEYAPFGLEFIVKINDYDNAQILVHPGYNVTKGKYYPELTYDGKYENILVLTNKQRITKDGTNIEAIYENSSILNYGILEDNSCNLWNTDKEKIIIRIPWMLINFSDPSDMIVLYDDDIITQPLRDEIETVKTEGIMISSILYNSTAQEVTGRAGSINQEPLSWESWDIPGYSERMKESYYLIQEYFK